jgi:hypothetical protein
VPALQTLRQGRHPPPAPARSTDWTKARAPASTRAPCVAAHVRSCSRSRSTVRLSALFHRPADRPLCGRRALPRSSIVVFTRRPCSPPLWPATQNLRLNVD